MKEYKKHLKNQNLENSTLKSYLWHLEKFYNWLGKEKITEKKLKEYFEHLLKKYKKISTINLRLIILNNYLSFLNKKFRFDLLSEQPKPAKILTSQELEQFLENPLKNKKLSGQRDKALLELLYSTGIKVGQLIKIRTNQIDEIKKEIILENKTKLQIKPLAWFYLKKYLSKRNDNEPWLFINFDRSRKSKEKNLTIRSVERIISKYAKGIDPPLTINPQILRNTLAYQLKSQGAKGDEIGRALHFKTKTGAKNYFKRI